MYDHNLDDLIIDNIEPKNSKLKSFLTIIALLIVILIVAIVLTRILLKSPEKNDLVFEQEASELIAPELKLQEMPKKQETKEEPLLSNISESQPESTVVENEKSETVKEETVVAKEEPKPAKPQVEEAKEEPVLSNITEEEIKAPDTVEETSSAEKEAKDAADVAHWESVQAKRNAEQEAAKEQETVEAETPSQTEEVAEPIVEKPKPVVKPSKKPVVQKPVEKPVASRPEPKSTSTTQYYVQVGSFKTQPSSRFISVIQNNGFNYRIVRSPADGTNKLLIGPYENRASVDRALRQVKDRINKSAFVVKR